MSNELNNLSYANEGSLYVPKPIGELLKTAQALKGQYDAGVVAADAATAILDSANARDLNKAALKGKYDEYKVGLDEVAKRGNFEDFVPQAKKIARGFANDPTVKGIVKDYQDAQAWTAEQKARIGAKENGISESDFRRALILNQTQNNKPLEYDPVTGVYKNSFNGNTIPQNIDFNEKIQEMVKAFNESSTEHLGPKAHGYLQSITEEGKDPKKLRELVSNYIMQSDEAKNLLAFRANADMTSTLMQSDGSLRPITVKDLAKVGVVPASGIPLKPVYDEKGVPLKKDGEYVMEEDTELKKILYNPDGTVNQENAMAYATSAKMSEQKEQLFNYGASFANKKIKVDYLQDLEAARQHAFALAKYTADRADAREEKKKEPEYNQYLAVQASLDALAKDPSGPQSVYVPPSMTKAILGDKIDVNSMISGFIDTNDAYSTKLKALQSDLGVKFEGDATQFIKGLQSVVSQSLNQATTRSAGYGGKWGLPAGMKAFTPTDLTKVREELKSLGFVVNSNEDVKTIIKYAKENSKKVTGVLDVANAIQQYGSQVIDKFSIAEGNNTDKHNVHVIGNKYYTDVEADLGEIDTPDKVLTESGFLKPHTTGKGDKAKTTYTIHGKYRTNFTPEQNVLYNKATNNKTSNYIAELQNQNSYALKNITDIGHLNSFKTIGRHIKDIPNTDLRNEARVVYEDLQAVQNRIGELVNDNLLSTKATETAQYIADYYELYTKLANIIPKEALDEEIIQNIDYAKAYMPK